MMLMLILVLLPPLVIAIAVIIAWPPERRRSFEVIPLRRARYFVRNGHRRSRFALRELGVETRRRAES